MKKKTIRDIELKGKKVLVRVDFNVPLDIETGEISDDSRIRAALPTIEYLVKQGSRVILCSHFSRPKGKVVEGMRLAPMAKRLSDLLGSPVKAAMDCVGTDVEAAVAGLGDGDVVLLENLRFHPEEENNDPEFAKALAKLADVYVNDAFGTAHRAHASTSGVADYLPAVAGFLMEKEIDYLGRALSDPARPFAMIVGGAKVADKIALLENILQKVNTLIIGGGMANTFVKAQGYNIGKSRVEEDQLGFARALVDQAKERGVRLLLPVDAVAAEEFAAGSKHKTVSLNDVPEDWMILDIGPQSIRMFSEALKDCRTIVWNGPMGVFEYPDFAAGTNAIAVLVAELEAITIIGGGDTAAAVEKAGVAARMSHISTGGGASLELLEGKILPGVAALQDK